MQYPLGKKIIHMISLHYLLLNEEKHAAQMLSPLLPGDTSPLWAGRGVGRGGPCGPLLHLGSIIKRQERHLSALQQDF